MNTREEGRWQRHAPAGATNLGINGLYDMGGNVWEWIADGRGDDALTAGGSWWGTTPPRRLRTPPNGSRPTSTLFMSASAAPTIPDP